MKDGKWVVECEAHIMHACFIGQRQFDESILIR